MTTDPPAHVAPALDLLKEYLSRLPDTPFLALGNHGSGRGHWIEATLRTAGYDPRWFSEPDPCPPFDMEDRALFAVYELGKPEVPPTTPSILLLPPDFERRDEWKALDWALFPDPPEWEREAFLAVRGLPRSLAAGNPTYHDLLHAGIAWEVARVEIRAELHVSRSWDEFRAGGDPPVPEAVVPYYAAYAFPPDQWWPGRNLGQARRATAVLGRILVDQIRLEWPREKPPFPDLLKEPKRGGKTSSPPPVTTAEIERPKGYHVDWE